jgi:hypothetical protein
MLWRRVQFTRVVDRYPHVLVQAGELGTVVAATDDTIAVRLDRVVPALAEWDNAVLFTKHMDTYEQFSEACRLMVPLRPRVWTCSITHRHGSFVTVHTSKTLARAAVATYVTEQWPNEIGDEMPDDPEEAIEQYFEEVEGEYADIDDTEVDGWPEDLGWPIPPEAKT